LLTKDDAELSAGLRRLLYLGIKSRMGTTPAAFLFSTFSAGLDG
jgi:hypothetical protein